MTKKERKALMQNLPKGWCKTLADKYQHSRSYIYQVISEEQNNPTILKEAIMMAAENKLNQISFTQKVKEQIKSLL